MRTLIQSRVIHIDRSHFSPICSNQVTRGISDIDDEISLMHRNARDRYYAIQLRYSLASHLHDASTHRFENVHRECHSSRASMQKCV